ncbi:hypothetical protein [Arthrobacter sp. B0490]|uniref:hypothetical protein n=1 Tax=Arthrobacter sp. B0490 TaxID=2058891 RepID=UPI0015E3AEB9|nr:hypothetical protein [Arthrobacter sp. B0490]
MSLVIVQPARNAVARKNYARTVDNPVSLTETASYLAPEDQQQLTGLHPSGTVPLWGTTAGERGQLKTRWDRISSGDTILFTGDSEVFKVGRVTHKFRSAGLADTLWAPKTTANGHSASWEYMYAFNQPMDITIPYTRIDQALRDLPFPTREFSVLTPAQSDRILEYLQMSGQEPPPPPTPASSQQMTWTSEEFDVSYLTRRRTEQAYLRQFLLKGGSGQCALCGRDFSKDFLVAAHIKKRSLCTDQEKADIPAVAMLACRFGCDELFERGMIVVAPDGRIKKTRRLSDEEARRYFTDYLRGRMIAKWDQRTSSHTYFTAHREHWR